MRGLIKKCFGVVSLLVLIVALFGCSDNKHADETLTINARTNYSFDYTFMYPKFSWEELDLSKVKYKTKEEFEQAVVNYIAQIETVTGVSNWTSAYGSDIDNIRFKVVFKEEVEGGGVASIENGYAYDNNIVTTMTISYSAIESGMPFLSHELCHFMLGNVFSRSIEEGFCDYLLRRIEGAGTSGFALDISVYDMMIGLNEEGIYKTCSEADIKAYEEFKEQEMLKVGNAGKVYPYGISGRQAKTWFGYSEAWVTYLIDKYGMVKFIKFYQDAECIEDYMMLDSRGYNVIVGEWIEYYNAYEPTVHYEEYR